MQKQTLAVIVEEGSKIISQFVQHFMFTTKVSATPTPSQTDYISSAVSPSASVNPIIALSQLATKDEQKLSEIIPTPSNDGDLPYRFECVVKHLGGASVILREAFERANDEGVGDGTAEKIIEAMNEHAGMEVDLEKMISAADVKPKVDLLMSGVRQFRAAAWKAGLPKGEGTKEDIEAAREWNDILLHEAITAMKAKPGTECIRQGM